MEFLVELVLQVGYEHQISRAVEIKKVLIWSQHNSYITWYCTLELMISTTEQYNLVPETHEHGEAGPVQFVSVVDSGLGQDHALLSIKP